MKKFISILIAMLTFCTLTSEDVAENLGAPISLRVRHPIGGATRPSKSPANFLTSLEVVYDSDDDFLYFYDEKDDTVSFFIYNDENVCVSQGACNFNESHSYSMSLGLGTGSYTIIVLINGVEYCGNFDG